MNPLRMTLVALAAMSALMLPMGTQAQTTHTVTVGDNFFSPANLTIQVGDTVQWVNEANGGNNHNTTSDDGLWASTTAESWTFSFTFEEAGSFDYTCTVHPIQMTGTITVEGTGGGEADLAVNSVDATAGTYAPGDSISIDISIENVGGADSDPFLVEYYASTDSSVSTTDTLLGSDNRNALAAGAMDNFTAMPTFPGGIADGTYFIGAIIDVNDANNGNNSGVDNATVAVSSPQQEADLALTEVSAPSGSFAQGSMFMVEAEVENVGGTASGDFAIDYYASTNNDITTQDRLLGTENRSGLAAGENASAMFQLTIPGDLSPGDYFIGGIIDIDDANNGNNDNLDDEALTVTESNGEVFPINAGLNDSWFNPATPGQGFFITVFPDIEMMFLAWFTYELERPPEDVTAMLGGPGHRWLTAFGPYSGDTAMLDIEVTTGGTFDSPTPETMQVIDGSMTVTFTGCNAGSVEYNIPSVSVSGTVPIERIAGDNIPFCESMANP